MFDDALYTGSPNDPQIGDLRITFWGSTASHASGIGVQRRRENGSFVLVEVSDAHEVPGRNGTIDIVSPGIISSTLPDDMSLFREGDYSPEELIGDYYRISDGNPMVVWGVRVAATLSILGLVLASRRINERGQDIRAGSLLGGSLLVTLFFVSLITGLIWTIGSIPVAVVLLLTAAATFGGSIALWCKPRVTFEGVPQNSTTPPQNIRTPLNRPDHFYQPI
eukprot:GHVO01033086.1.p1 GENE.GHVO01033086.1~~GHVO01033086.1.p1  ORF type:complete len:231 (-),score=8.64 GHVO01033086.1:390-1055(-)